MSLASGIIFVSSLTSQSRSLTACIDTCYFAFQRAIIRELEIRLSFHAGSRAFRQRCLNPTASVFIESQALHACFCPWQQAVRRVRRAWIEVDLLPIHLDNHEIGLQLFAVHALGIEEVFRQAGIYCWRGLKPGGHEHRQEEPGDVPATAISAAPKCVGIL